MATMKIKKGDMVRVIAGREKNNEGKVIAVDHKNGKVVVEGLMMATKHVKPSMGNAQGGIMQKEAAIDISNVMLLHNGKPTRVGFNVEKDDNGKVVKKSRVAKATGEVIDVVFEKKN